MQRPAIMSEHKIRFGHLARQVQMPNPPRVVAPRDPSQDDAEVQEREGGEDAQCHAGRLEAGLRGQRTAKFREQ